jgi:predicted AlkP superfamily phosphohydrolase/phosphomutase
MSLPRARSLRHALVPPLLPGLLALVLLPLSGCDGSEGEIPRRAILVSLDALNEEILHRTLDQGQAPTLHAIFEGGTCADHAVAAFPSLTAPSHAVLWTGAYGDVTGAAGNSQHRLPRSGNTVLDMTSGFVHDVLGAEAIWISAGRVGVPVAGHHVTQAPGVPGYPGVDGERTPEQEARREEARGILAQEGVDVFRGYQWMLEPHRVLTATDVEWTDPADWIGLEEVGDGREGRDDGLEARGEGTEEAREDGAGAAGPLPLRSFRWETGAGIFHGLLHGGDRYEAVTVAPTPDFRLGVTARLHPAEAEDPGDRKLARHFSPTLEVPVEAGSLGGSLEESPPLAGRVHLRVRLFEVEEDGSDFLLYHPALHPVAGNTPEVMEAYDRGVGGWLGNSAMWLYMNGGFGPTLESGGDGTAEARFLESAELLLRQFMRGSEWMWRERSPRLMLDYFPLSDTVDHNLLGFMDPEWPGYDPVLAEAVAEFRAQAWRLVDLRLAHLLELAREDDAALFVTGDHGMRASWNLLLPNLVLKEAGLLALNEDGTVDLSRTRAVSPNGYWISVNRTAWRDGIVPPEEEEEVIAAVRAALEGVVDGDGTQVVTRTFTPGEHPEMGLGGAAGGDVYWGTAHGYRAGAGLQDRQAHCGTWLPTGRAGHVHGILRGGTRTHPRDACGAGAHHGGGSHPGGVHRDPHAHRRGRGLGPPADARPPLTLQG